jgi:hypothetical protein
LGEDVRSALSKGLEKLDSVLGVGLLEDLSGAEDAESIGPNWRDGNLLFHGSLVQPLVADFGTAWIAIFITCPPLVGAAT